MDRFPAEFEDMLTHRAARAGGAHAAVRRAGGAAPALPAETGLVSEKWAGAAVGLPHRASMTC